jgi:hypothetical protein
MDKKIYQLIWRLVAVICMLAWSIVLIHDLNIHIQGITESDGQFLTPLTNVILCGIIIFALGLLILYPLEFRIYAVLLSSRGLLNLIDGGSTSGLLMYMVGLTFAFHSGFFKKYREIKIILVTLFPILAIVSQARFSMANAALSFLNFIAIIIMLGLVFLLFLPDIRKMRKQVIHNTQIVYIPAEKFTDRDIRCLKKVQAGEKYESISSDENIGLSTLKNRMKVLYKSLDVYDKTTFMSAYAGYTILLKPTTETTTTTIIDSESNNNH